MTAGASRLSGVRLAVGLAFGLAFLAFSGPGDAQETARTILASSPCAGTASPPGTTLLYGVLRDGSSDVPLPGATAVLSWRVPEAQGEYSTRTLESTSDGRGLFWFCDAPAGVRLSLEARVLGSSASPKRLRLREGRLHREDLTLTFHEAFGAVSGRLVDAGTEEPIEAATVGLEEEDAGILTDSQGRFRLRELPAGVQDLVVRHVAYGEQSVTVDVQPQRTAFVQVKIAPSPIALEPIAVTLEQRERWLEDTGFYFRASRGLGQFVTPEEIEKKHLRNFHQILENVQGLDLQPVCRGAHCFFYVGSSTGAGCVPTFYVDGRKVWRPRVMDLNALTSAHDVAAVEVYRGISQTPAEFYGQCGSVVIWTKRAAG